MVTQVSDLVTGKRDVQEDSRRETSIEVTVSTRRVVLSETGGAEL